MQHVPVMVEEVMEALGGLQTGLVIDGTLGLGGHSEAWLQRTPPPIKLIGLDRDPAAVAMARERLTPFGDRVECRHASYDQIPEILRELGRTHADRILLDLGLSSAQLAEPRGFSFAVDAPLDMRFDPTSGPTAADIIRQSSEMELAAGLMDFGDVPRAQRLAGILKDRARAGRMGTVSEFVDACRTALGSRVRSMDSATLPAQALRIMTNRELERLRSILDALPEVLAPGGRIAVLSYHSGEDGMVKRAFREFARNGGFVLPIRKALQASDSEKAVNRRARSARLRILARMETSL